MDYLEELLTQRKTSLKRYAQKSGQIVWMIFDSA